MSSVTSHPRGVRLDVRDLTRSYREQVVLNKISFAVEPGEIFVVMGPSGSGKSVLLKHLIGLEKPDAGTILIENDSIHAPGVMDRYRMAMVFQSGALLNSLTVAENVGLYLSEHRLKTKAEIDRVVTEKLNQVGLAGYEDQYPAVLSGGMKKRAAMARALVTEPQLILYDEPTSELDPLMAVVIGNEISTLNNKNGVTSIVVTHDRDLAFGIADRIAILRQGEILTVGTPQEVRASTQPLIQEFLTVRFKHHSKRVA